MNDDCTSSVITCESLVSQLFGQTNQVVENINQKPSAPKYSGTVCRPSFAAHKMQHTTTVHSNTALPYGSGQIVDRSLLLTGASYKNTLNETDRLARSE